MKVPRQHTWHPSPDRATPYALHRCAARTVRRYARAVRRCYRVSRGMLKSGMTARQARGPKFRRVTLYLTPRASERLDAEAAERSERAGVEVSPEAAARGLVYSGLGLSVDGNTDVSSPMMGLVEAVRAVVDYGMKAPMGSPEARPKLNAMAAALEKAEKACVPRAAESWGPK